MRSAVLALALYWLALPLGAPAQPANDNFADRIALTGSSLSVTGSNVDATKEAGEPTHAGWQSGGGDRSVWWSWTAPSATPVRIDTIGSGFSTVLAIYTGSVVSNLNYVASAGQSGSTNDYYYSQAGFVPTAGVEYAIAVDTEWGGTGNVVLNILNTVPIITSQPRTQSVPPGSNATFTVVAAGAPPLAYQWRKNGTAITDATSTALTLTNVQTGDAASYSVVVTNGYGNITSGSAVLSVSTYEPYFFTTIAGKAGVEGAADGTGDEARFSDPAAIALDGAGNLYIADLGNHTIRKLTRLGTNWMVSTVAGMAGSSGFVDGTNSNARFFFPNGVAVDSSGTLYVTDRFNSAVRRIVPSGTNWVVSTIATGFYGLGGCAVDRAGIVYVAETTVNHAVKRIVPSGATWLIRLVAGGGSGSADGTNGAARFHAPDRVAVDAATNLYVSDVFNGTIRKITPSGANWVVSTLAGLAGQRAAADGTNGGARFSSPEGVGLDAAGNIYVGDWNGTVRKITPAGVTTTLGGLASYYASTDGAGSAARFNEPNGITVDSHGIVYLVDDMTRTVRMGWPMVQMQCPPAALASQIQTQGFGGTISLASGLNYWLQTSSDLTNWADLTNFTPAGLSQPFVDPTATNQPRRFYRVVGP